MRWWVFLSLISLFVLTACPEPSGPEFINFNQGTKGLEFRFMDNSPPQKVYAGDTFPITILMENKGSYPLINPLSTRYDSIARYTGISSKTFASLSLVYDDLYFSEDTDLSSVRNEVLLSGKNIFFPEGESQIMLIALLKANLLNGRMGAKESVGVNLCYPYETTLTERICIDADPYDQDARFKNCRAEDLHYSGGQGGPIAITDIELRSATTAIESETVDTSRPVYDEEGYIVGWDKSSEDVIVSKVSPSLHITLRNVGSGTVVRAKEFGEQQLCGPHPVLPSGSVMVHAQIGNTTLNCSFGGVTKFISNTAEITCNLPLEESFSVNTNYFATLRVGLSYNYRISDSIDIEIDDSLREHSPIKIYDQLCSDYNADEGGCKSFGGASYLGLNCYWCEGSQQCLSEDCTGCANNWAFAPTRSCIDACPKDGQPIASNLPPSQGSVMLRCENAPGVTKASLVACGCSQFKYQFIENAPACPPINQFLGKTALSSSSYGGSISARVDIPPSFQQGASGVLCYAGVSGNGATSNVETVRFNMGSAGEVAEGLAFYLIGGPVEDAAQDSAKDLVNGFINK